MKTSNYIILAFFIFFFGAIGVVFIDSKLYEDEYKALQKGQLEIWSLRSQFNQALDNYKKDNTNLKKWNTFIETTKQYIDQRQSNIKLSKQYPYKNSFVYDINSACWNVYLWNKKMNTPDATSLALEWGQLGVSLNPDDAHMNETYANLLFEMGLISDAVKHQEKAVTILQKQGHKWANMYEERLERFKAHLTDQSIKLGGTFVDVTPTDIEGTPVTLSSLIKGKVALLNFWTSSSPYSIEKSRELFPTYNTFKDKGFVIVGIANENKYLKKMKKTLETEKYPWLNLVDLNRNDRIWDKYDVLNTAYRTFLIDKNGVVIAINPTVNQLENILNKLLN